MPDEVEVRVVEATGVAFSHGANERPDVKAMEDAMIAAVEQAAKDEITDPDKIRALMLAARDNALV